MQHKNRTFALAMLFESGLGFVGLGIAWLAGISMVDRLQLTQTGIERGLLATLPMLLMLPDARRVDPQHLAANRRNPPPRRATGPRTVCQQQLAGNRD